MFDPQAFSIYDEKSWKQKKTAVGDLRYQKLVTDELHGMSIYFAKCPAGLRTDGFRAPYAIGVYLISGALCSPVRAFEPGAFVWYRKDTPCTLRVPEDGEAMLLIVTGREPSGSLPWKEMSGAEDVREAEGRQKTMDAPEAAEQPGTAEQPASQPECFSFYEEAGWYTAEGPAGVFYRDKLMVSDPDTGMIANFSHYPKGYDKTRHRHTCSHAIYVISGTLRTDEGRYGAGSLVWHPAGHCGTHGSVPEDDCAFLFLANKPFDIEFLNALN